MLNSIKDIFKDKQRKKTGEFCSAIIVAAGSGSRMQSSKNKQFIEIIDRPVLAYTLQAFEDSRLVDEIIVVTREQEIMQCKEIVDIAGLHKVKTIIAGGKQRQDSVYNGLQQISEKASIVAVHDGARPLILTEHIDATIETAREYSAAAIGVRLKDTIKIVDDENNIINTLERSKIWAVQTPQVFRVELIKQAYEKARKEGIAATDDCMLVEQLGHKIKMVEGSYENIKLTTPEDIFLAEAIIDGRVWEREDFD